MTSHIAPPATLRRQPLRLAPIACLFALVATASMVVQSAPRPEFIIEGVSVRELGTLGDAGGGAVDVNDRGDAVGWSRIPAGPVHAALFSDGIAIDVGAWYPGRHSMALGINNDGLVVGYTVFGHEGTPEQQAFAWIRGWLVDLDTRLGGVDPDCWRHSQARAVNDAGGIAGTVGEMSHGPPCAGLRVARWDGPTARPSEIRSTAIYNEPHDLAADGTVVGWHSADLGGGSRRHAARWRGLWSLIPLPVTADHAWAGGSAAFAINARGDVVGERGYVGGGESWNRAFFWPAGSPTALELPGPPDMEAKDINNDRFIVGTASLSRARNDRQYAFLFHPSFGVRFLPELTPKVGQSCGAEGVNERNPATGVFQVVGWCVGSDQLPVRWDVRAVRPAPSTTP